MNTTITLRNATTSDLPVILSITNDAILHSTAHYAYEPQTLAVQTQWFEDKLAQNWPVIVAEADGKAVGFGTYGSFRVREGYRFTVEHSVYLQDDFQGRGIGQMLLLELVRLAKTQGFHTMIGVIDAANTGSCAFHARNGFEQVGHLRQVGYKFGQWLDLVLMQKML
ncbi:phosphinothricin acetyltransferase [Flexibacter flexilis DSM 6793]|uniref:Phosphinothricin acetyltransferase n=1 Tax=Flexibacter flexilis DSM 6793 TaxID=927664 RepID=A0A1I1N3B8_9BACT|nr:GNAT family N-acetyltransferase [Flexibacter flexilis]SFC92117.1 phosphinothricin acetyltransferase [Flexibacter flexilis DSM 6793]